MKAGKSERIISEGRLAAAVDYKKLKKDTSSCSSKMAERYC